MSDESRLHDEVIQVARDLIRLDTTNAREPGLGNETLCAAYLQDYLQRNGVEAELVAREPDRANIVARIPGTEPGAESLALVGHTDVVPCDPRDWTHPPFEAVVDEDGWLWGRGAVDMKNEVAARAVAIAELGRSGFRPVGDLWFIAVADEEDGFADVGMRWLMQERTDVRPTHSVNEGGGERLCWPTAGRWWGTPSARRAPSRSGSRPSGRPVTPRYPRSAETPYLCWRGCSLVSATACRIRARHPRPSPCCEPCSAATSRTWRRPSPRRTGCTTASATRFGL
jgi:hypothetical protein